MAQIPNTPNQGIKAAISAAQAAKIASKMVKRNSIVRKAKPGIYQFPVLMSSNTANDKVVDIARGIEKLMAGITVTAYSLDPIMATDKFDTVSDYVKSFHNNDGDINFTALNSSLESFLNSEVDKDNLEVTIESMQLTTESGYPEPDALWDITEEQLNGSILNEVYQPYKRTATEMTDKIRQIYNTRTAMEAKDPSDIQKYGNALKDELDRFKAKNDTLAPVMGDNVYNDKEGNKRNENGGIKKHNEIVYNAAATNLEPTIIRVNIVVRDKVTGSYPISLTLGIKAMVRLVRSDLMVSAMVDATKNSRFLFRFIRWTRGELKFFDDFILNKAEIKASVVAKNSIETAVIRSAMKRKKVSRLFRLFGTEIFPTLTIILTQLEVEKIKEITGVDLSKPQNVLSIMNKYYLLCFGIVDSISDSFMYMLDSDTNFTFTSMDSLRAQSGKNNMNVTDVKDLLQAIGRV